MTNKEKIEEIEDYFYHSDPREDSEKGSEWCEECDMLRGEGHDSKCKLGKAMNLIRSLPILDGSTWLIWSIEHAGWWMPESRGYTKQKDRAGRYSFYEAAGIVKRANEYAGDTPKEAMVRDEDRAS